MNRRNFLARSGAIAAGSLLAHDAFAAPVPAPSAGAVGTEPTPSKKYVPGPKAGPVVKGREFVFAAAHLDHSHINDQCSELIAAGAVLKWVFEPDETKRKAFTARFTNVQVARSLDEVLADPEVKLVACAAVTSERGPIGCRVMQAGKDYFCDKAPFTTLAQLEEAKSVVTRTGRKYFVYYGERLRSEAGMYATDLVASGVLGRVLQVVGLGPHRLGKASRPKWFFERAKYGGILCDIGSHQCEQFLTYAGASDARVAHAAVGNFDNPDVPEFEDFGTATFVANNGATNQIRVDWFTPAGLSNWGDGRTFILGTKGFIELRKYAELARGRAVDHVYLVDESGEHYIPVAGKVGYRYFGQLILDSLNRTEKAMTQAHAFKAAELCLQAQAAAIRLTA